MEDIVALVIPTYAKKEDPRLAFLLTTLETVAYQKAGVKVLPIVVNDGAQPCIEECIREFIEGHNNFDVRCIPRERSPSDLKSSSMAINAGWEHLMSEIYSVLTRKEKNNLKAGGFLHSDDGLTEGSIQCRYDALGDGFVYTPMLHFQNREIVDLRKGYYGTEPNSMLFKLSICARQLKDDTIWFNNHTILMNIDFMKLVREHVKRKYGQSGLFDERLTHIEDLDFALSAIETALATNSSIRYVEKPSYLYRRHGNSITGEGEKKEKISFRQMLHDKHFGNPLAIFEYLQNSGLKLSPALNRFPNGRKNVEYNAASKELERMLAYEQGLDF